LILLYGLRLVECTSKQFLCAGIEIVGKVRWEESNEAFQFLSRQVGTEIVGISVGD